MVDLIFDEPRLAGVYDALDPDRGDLDVYVAIAGELGARSVVDVGCGTGTLACRLAEAGLEVIGVDPAAAMLDVARTRAPAGLVRWVHGMVGDLPPLGVDLVSMTGNVAQVFLTDEEWATTVAAVHRRLAPGGSFVFETRRPEREAWREWNRAQTYQRVEIAGVGVVESWNDVTEVDLPFVTFDGTVHFHADDTTLVSTSTLRFRSHDEVTAWLVEAGFAVRDVRDAPDRPGKELVFIAQRQ